jgi:MYXO-CTERM domain-containing protein
VTCVGDRVCEGGVCVPSCKCAGCAAGKTCDAKGSCVEPGCSSKTCGANEVCAGGSCVDKCAGAVCPRGQMCTAGACVDIPKPDGGVIVMPNYDSGLPPNGAGGSGFTGAGGGTFTGAAGTAGIAKISPSSGCGCAIPKTEAAGWAALLACAALFSLRRRRA